MREIIFNSHTYEILLDDATQLGFVDADGNIITNGTFESGGGWFLNVVGTVYEPVTPPANPDDPWPAPVPRDGYWGRLRLNGTPDEMPPFSDAITQYVWSDTLNEWVNIADGTPAPAWVADIGIIA